MVKRPSQKISKTTAIGQIEKQKAEFSELLDSINKLVPDPERRPWDSPQRVRRREWLPRKDVAPTLSPYEMHQSMYKMGKYYERVLSTLRQTVVFLYQLRSQDNALKFEADFDGICSYSSFTFTNPSPSENEADAYYEDSQKIISASVNQLEVFKRKIIMDWQDTKSKSSVSDSSMMRKLRFGKDSAEDDREFIEKAFLYTSFYQRIRSGEKHLVLGRKGTGKTAACLKMYDYLDKQGAEVTLITPRDLTKFVVTMLEKASINALASQLLAWKQVFLRELGLYILEEANKVYGPHYLNWPKPIQNIHKFIVHNVKGKDNWIDKTFKIVGTVRKLALKLVGMEVSAELASPETASIDPNDFVSELDQVVDDIVNVSGSLMITPIYILVDKVDELWDPTPESKALIIGLLRAAKELGEQIKAANVIVFLRSDIYGTLQFNDSDRFHGWEERIVWKKPDLKKMIALRAASSTGIRRQDAYDQIWETFFPSEIEDKDSSDYLLQYTLMRPRDLIQLCNLCRDKAQNNDHQKIETSDIFEALPQYSEWKLQDLRDEYRIQYPFLESVFLNIFYRSTPFLTKNTIIQSFKDIKEKLINQYGDYYFNQIETLLQVLYNIGFLGVVTKKGVLYSYLEDKAIVADASEFSINPVFRWALAIKPIGIQGGSNRVYTGSGSYVISGSQNISGAIWDIKQNTILPFDIIRLRNAILENYSLIDLRNLATKLNVDKAILEGNNSEIIVYELTEYCVRHGSYPELVNQVIKDHPDLADELSKISDITNSNLSGFVVGESNRVVTSLNIAGQLELAQALSTLAQAVLASHDLTPEQKQEHVEVINQIGEEAAKPKPNKITLKVMINGILAALKAVPDVAGAVTAVMPLLSQLYP